MFSRFFPINCYYLSVSLHNVFFFFNFFKKNFIYNTCLNITLRNSICSAKLNQMHAFFFSSFKLILISLIFVLLGFDSLQVAPQLPGKMSSFASTHQVPQLFWVISHFCFFLLLPWLATCHSFTLTKENQFQILFCSKAPTSPSSLMLLCKYKFFT